VTVEVGHIIHRRLRRFDSWDAFAFRFSFLLRGFGAFVEGMPVFGCGRSEGNSVA